MSDWRDARDWENDRTFVGVISQEVRDAQDEIIPMAAFEEALPRYMERGVLIDEHSNEVRGKPLAWKIDGDKAYVKFGVFGDTENDNKFWKTVKDCGDKCGLSIGGDPEERGPNGTVKRLGIFEVSFLGPGVDPANPGAFVVNTSMAKSADCPGDCPAKGVCKGIGDGVFYKGAVWSREEYERFFVKREDSLGKPLPSFATMEDCMSDAGMRAEFPRQDQLAAVCFGIIRGAKSESATHQKTQEQSLQSGSGQSQSQEGMTVTTDTKAEEPAKKEEDTATKIEERIANLEAKVAELQASAAKPKQEEEEEKPAEGEKQEDEEEEEMEESKKILSDLEAKFSKRMDAMEKAILAKLAPAKPEDPVKKRGEASEDGKLKKEGDVPSFEAIFGQEVA